MPPDSRLSDQQIERIVVQLQRQLWGRKRSEVGSAEVIDPLSLLDPEKAIDFFGYNVDLAETLGQFSERGETFEVAGILDRDNRGVRLSMQFRHEFRNFTAAHELGHLVLHSGTGLHNDRPLDRRADTSQRSYPERQADVFATYFLMPKKQVQKIFQRMYLAVPFVFNAEALSAFNTSDREAILRANTPRERTMLFAGSEFYNGQHLVPLMKLFGVSQTAMAIRLEELGVVT